jgi:hypothetical protein
MNYRILLMGLLAATITSCSTYKAGQTPDDVYYSPAREIVRTGVKQETKQEDKYETLARNEDDQYLRMKVRNHNRWSTIDDYGYWYDSRYDHCSCNCYPKQYGWGTGYYYNPYRPNWYYGSYYSPAYPIVFYRNPKVYTGNTGKTNLVAYRNNSYSNTNYNYNPKNPQANTNYNFGNLIKQVFTTPNGSTSVERPARTFEPNTQTSSDAGGRSGGYDSKGSSTNSGRGGRN